MLYVCVTSTGGWYIQSPFIKSDEWCVDRLLCDLISKMHIKEAMWSESEGQQTLNVSASRGHQRDFVILEGGWNG